MQTAFCAFHGNKAAPATAQSVNRNQPTSLYVLGPPAPTLKNEMYGKAVMIGDSSLKLLQIVVASKVFHNAEEGRFDTVIVHFKKLFLFKVKPEHSLRSGSAKLWLSFFMQSKKHLDDLCPLYGTVVEIAL